MEGEGRRGQDTVAVKAHGAQFSMKNTLRPSRLQD